MRVKICGITRQEDAELAIELGADALGFNFEKSSPRFIPIDSRYWISNLEPYAHCVAIYAKSIDRKWCGCNSIQCIESPRTFPEFIPPLFKVIRPRSLDASVACLEFGTWLHDNAQVPVRGVLLDSFDEHAYGGTGKPIDWDFAAEFVKLCPKPVILAGGLTPTNVSIAIAKVRPYAVDVSSGVESSPGIKDPIKIRDFIQAAKEAGRE